MNRDNTFFVFRAALTNCRDDLLRAIKSGTTCKAPIGVVHANTRVSNARQPRRAKYNIPTPRQGRGLAIPRKPRLTKHSLD